MPVTFYQPGVCAVETKQGGANQDGFVSWRLEGHWSLNQAGYAAILTQVAGYIASRTALSLSNTATNAPFMVNDSLGQFFCANSSLASQAASISVIVSNTGYLNGGN